MRVKIEKSELAKELEKKLGFKWELFQGYSEDAGYDVRACIEKPIYLTTLERVIIPTGLFIEMESPNWEIQVRPRSGLAAKYGITVLNSPGTIDFNYREEIKVILFNSTRALFKINSGDRIAQLCFREIPEIYFENINSIEKTARGGFGSTGTK